MLPIRHISHDIKTEIRKLENWTYVVIFLHSHLKGKQGNHDNCELSATNSRP